MKNKLLILFIAFIGVFNCSKAQNWVQIPDPNFGEFLLTNYPNAAMLSGGDYFIDADHADITLETDLILSNLSISNISGIGFFTNLQYLDCSFNQLSNITTLPQNLLYLDASYNQLTTLPVLPQNLTSLKIYNNQQITGLSTLPPNLETLDCGSLQLSSLPTLPQSLINLSCNNNQLTSLPALPQSLLNLSCSNNQLNSLPTLPQNLNYLYCGGQVLTLPILPPNLSTLYCGGSQLTSLPILPSSLTYLYCTNNYLVSLPTLPSNLTSLFCGANYLSNLPTLPQSLVSLSCYTNQLTSLPALPQGLKSLNCTYNQLSSLPDLPQELEYLNCTYNQLQCMPTLPNSLNWIELENNLLMCLPNYGQNVGGSNLSAYPLCFNNDVVNNPNGCPEATGIAGVAFNDYNNDCISNSNIPGVQLQLFDSSLTPLSYFNTISNGSYFLMATAGDYIVAVNEVILPNSLIVSCPSNNSISVNLTAIESFSDGNDFGLSCSGFDLGTQAVYTTGWVFPGQIHAATIIAGDLSAALGMDCAAGVSGEINVSVSGPSSSISFPGSSSFTSNSATYVISDFEGFLSDFVIQIQTDTTAQAGDQFCITVNVSTSNTNDLDPTNNSYTYCYNVVNSYDPNIKLTTPEIVLPNYQDEFTYTIYFQNTGSAPAFNIRLEDVIDQNLDLSTFRPVAASHYYTTSVSLDTRNLIVRFPNIMLPDSTSNPEGSIGFIQYRIKPVSNLPEGTIIENTAGIYFDFNAPIITNTTQNLFSQSAHLANIEKSKLLMYPNPAEDILSFSGAKVQKVVILDVLGKEVISQAVNANSISIQGIESGIYFVEMHTEFGVESQRLVVRK